MYYRFNLRENNKMLDWYLDRFKYYRELIYDVCGADAFIRNESALNFKKNRLENTIYLHYDKYVFRYNLYIYFKYYSKKMIDDLDKFLRDLFIEIYEKLEEVKFYEL